MRVPLFPKLLIAFLALSFPPLLWLSIDTTHRIETVGAAAVEQSTQALDAKASRTLELQAIALANEVSSFLEERVQDLRILADLPREPEVFASFSRGRVREVWKRRRRSHGEVEEYRVLRPVYAELAWIGLDGTEVFRVEQAQPVPVEALRDVSDPSQTTYGVEDYFREALGMPPGKPHVGHLVGRHVGKDEQLAGAPTPEEAVDGAEYRGLIRFALAVWEEGAPVGVVAVAVDHCHLMEFTQHVLPLSSERVVFPSYGSGDYAFLFDDEGWIITHPKFWNLRGIDASGRWLPAYSASSDPADVKAGRIPFNLDAAEFIHPNYPLVSHAVRTGRSGVTQTYNVAGVGKVMAYAPIRFRHGAYQETGVFGGVTLGARTEAFHREAALTGRAIEGASRQTLRTGLVISWILALAVLGAAFWMSRAVSEPVHTMARMAQRIASGDLSARVTVDRQDEIGDLAQTLNRTAHLLEEKDQNLRVTLTSLERSRDDIRNYAEALRESKDRYEDLANLLPEIVYEMDDEGTLTFLNRGGFESLGYSPGDLSAGLDVYELFTPEYLDQARENVRRILSGGKSIANEYELQRKDGSTFPVLAHSAAIVRDSEVVGLRGVAVDISERKGREEERRKLAEGVAHQVRNPVVSIGGFARRIRKQVPADDPSRDSVEIILSEVQRLERMVSDIQKHTSLPQPELRVVSLLSVVEKAVDECVAELEPTGIRVERRFPDHVPAVLADGKLLELALEKILVNAMQAMPNGGDLEVAVFTKGDRVCVRVRDTGRGIAPEDLPHVFDPFVSSNPQATGLGLTTAQRIISEHNGEIKITSRVGEGTAVNLCFLASSTAPQSK